MNWAIVFLIVAGCLIGWKLTSKDMHDPSNTKYSLIDHYGWWIVTVGFAILGLAVLVFS